MKSLRFAAVMAICVPLLFDAGCSGTAGSGLASGSGPKYAMVVAFPTQSPLIYKVNCKKNITLQFGGGSKLDASSAAAKQEMTEESEFVFAYRTIGTAERGGTIVEVTCQKAMARRNRLSGGSSSDDAINTLTGKKYTFSVSASGRIFDANGLEMVIHDLGEAAFGGRNDRYEGRRIKNPDMIGDFIAVQWYAWDQQQSIPKPLAGVAVGQEWKSQRKPLAPMPFVSRTGRSVKYALAAVEQTGSNLRAVIKSAFSLADGSSMDWPMPYLGTFSQRGSFGFFQGYKVQELSGEGSQLFDLTDGIILGESQTWTAKVSAVIPFGGLLGKDGEKPEPNIIVKQTITTQLMPVTTPAQ